MAETKEAPKEAPKAPAAAAPQKATRKNPIIPIRDAKTGEAIDLSRPLKKK